MNQHSLIYIIFLTISIVCASAAIFIAAYTFSASSQISENIQNTISPLKPGEVN